MPRGVDFYDTAALQGRLWLPEPDMEWDASHPGSIESGTGVSTWKDRRPLGFNGTQATGSKRPTFEPLGLDGVRPALRFASASDQTLVLPSFSSLSWTAATVFYVWRLTQADFPLTADDTGPVFGVRGDSSLLEHEPWTDGTIFSSCFTAARLQVGDPAPSLKLPRITSIVSSNSVWEYWLDGKRLFQASSPTFTLRTIETKYIGSSSDTVHLDGWISHLAVFGRQLPELERQRAEGAYAWKWGLAKNLSASSPFKNRPPLIGD